ncbi:hypothetical protein HCC61_06560 [Streptomyces sp. HNM0575]|uniref:hypothetical protein n=1 Tax=Streptomyces sp. HNM0575 TaxID=2716338 RepID=UPI00145E9B7F|nr:hypothetical protein [Streptomyces sp. HNM0575]NLU72344.1 hypothetical protein [Streptomyces sp. HNM0575]
MTDRRRRRAAPSDDASREENPFAAPPEGRPDRPWQPRGGTAAQGGTNGDDGSGEGHGTGSGPGSGGDGRDSGRASGRNGDRDGDRNGDRDRDGDRDGGRSRDRSAWGSQWSSRQPGRQSGGFGGSAQGGSPEGGNGEGDGEGSGGPGTGPGGGLARGMRWDPTDPPQRHARYSLHTGVWALFFSLFSLPEVGLLLGALSLYWGISALRSGKSPSGNGTSGKPSGKPSGRRGASGARATAEDVAGTDRTAPGRTGASEPPKTVSQIPVAVTPAQAAKSRTTAAISGLITATLALAVVAATFTFQQVYSEYFTCTQDALTQSSREDCKDLLPSELRPLLENRSSSAGGLQGLRMR